MPTFDDALNAVLDNTFYTAEYAWDATYDGTAIKLIEDNVSERTEQFPGFTTNAVTVWVRKSEVSEPEVGKAIIYDGIKWRVGPGMELSGGEWRLILIRDNLTT
jgi:hypothetical protein